MAEVLTKAGVLLAIIALGYLLKRGGIFRRTDYEVVSKIVFRITLPCAVATAFFEGFEPNPTLFIVTLLGLLTGVLLWAGAFLSTRGRGEESRAFYTQNLPGYNIGAFTLPFVQSFVGSFGVVTACMFDVGNSLMCTGGNYALTSTLMGKTEGGRLKTFLRRLFSSVTIDTYLVLLVLGLLNIAVPQPIVAFAERVGDANPFLSMLMIGMMLEFSFEADKVKKAALVLILRYGAGVLFALLFYFILPLTLEIRQVLVLLSFSPIPCMSPYFTELLSGDGSLPSFAASISFVVSVACITALILTMGIGV